VLLVDAALIFPLRYAVEMASLKLSCTNLEVRFGKLAQISQGYRVLKTFAKAPAAS
jgi:hypothetical protein